MAEISQSGAASAFSNISPFTTQQSPIGAQRVQDDRNDDDRSTGAREASERGRTDSTGERPAVVARASSSEEDDSVPQSQASSDSQAGFQRGSVVDIFV